MNLQKKPIGNPTSELVFFSSYFSGLTIPGSKLSRFIPRFIDLAENKFLRKNLKKKIGSEIILLIMFVTDKIEDEKFLNQPYLG